MKHPTILDVAHEAGVSKSLVSLVIRGSDRVSASSRRTVLEAADKLGYRPNAAARTMVRQRSYVIGVLVSNLHNPFFADVIDGIDMTATDAGYRSILTTGNRVAERERLAVGTLLEMRVDGLILVSPAFHKDFAIEVSRSVPTVVIGKATRAASVDSVTNDDRRGAAIVVDHLVELGHSRIAHIDGGAGAGSQPRRTGYKRSMRSHGLETEIRSVPGGFTEEGGSTGMQNLLAKGPPPTAVFVANDLAAIGVLKVLRSEGLSVPGDISLVGYDNTAMAASHRLGLTTVDQPRHDMGRTATGLIVSRIDQESTPASHVVLSPKLVVRESTAPPYSLTYPSQRSRQ
ncbi:MAG TPA: LacI family transcriptional regulator [Actinobacteria bacterium]|nr:catabolite control protein A [bacterium BMS3Bbin02]HDL42309.1 LacI family transcriptional regulator [Actinomycetota bacterium]